MAVWAQVAENRVTNIAPLAESDVPSNATKTDVFAYFTFSATALPRNTEVTFLIGKGTLKKPDSITQAPSVPKLTLAEVRSVLTPIDGIWFEGKTFEVTVGVEEALIRDESGNLVVANVAKASLEPILNVQESSFTVIAYTSYDKNGLDGRLQACEGEFSISSGDGQFLSILERYDPLGDTWVTLGPAAEGRSGPVLQSILGDLYLVGGFGGNFTGTNEKYTPGTDSWTKVKSMPIARAFSQSVVDSDELYVLGGFNYTVGGAVANSHKYDPVTDEWTELDSMPLGIAFGISQIFSDYIYVACGGKKFEEQTGTVLDFNGVVVRYGPLSGSPTWEVVDARYGTNITTAGLVQASSTLQQAAAIGDYTLMVAPGTKLPKTGAITLDRGSGGQATFVYTNYSIATGRVFLAAPLTVNFVSGTTAVDATLPNSMVRLTANSYVDGLDIVIVNGQTGTTTSFPEFATKITPSATFVTFDSVLTSVIPSQPLPRSRAGAVVYSGKLYVIGGSAEKSDWLDETDELTLAGATWAEKAEMLYARHSLGVAELSGLIYAVGGAGSGHEPGWLQITVETSPDSVRADGTATSSLLVTAKDASGDPPPDGTVFKARGIIYVPEVLEPGEEAALRKPTSKTKVSILPVLFSSLEMTMTDGQAATVLLPRSEDPIKEVESLFKFSQAGEEIPDQEALRNALNSEFQDKSSVVGTVRPLYSAALEVTVVDDFYFGSSDSDAAISGQGTNSALASNSFSFNPSLAQAGLSASVEWYSDITSIPNVVTIAEEVDADEAKEELDAIQDEIPFGASPHYDAMLEGVRRRADPESPDSKNVMVTASDNDENFSAATAQEVIDEANLIQGKDRFPVFVLSFIVTRPVSLAARRARTDVAALEKISGDTGGNSFSVVDESFVDFVIERIQTSAPSSLSAGTLTKTHELNGLLLSIKYEVDNLPATMTPPSVVGPDGNVASMKIWISDDDYNYEAVDVLVQPNQTYTFSEPLNKKYIKYEIALSSTEFDSPILNKVVLSILEPNVQYLFTYPISINGQVSELAAVVNHRLQLPLEFKHNGLTAEVGFYHGDSTIWDDYQNVSQPAIVEQGVTHAINRSFDTFINEGTVSTSDVLQSTDFLVYKSKSGPWPEASDIRIFVNGQESLATSYNTFPEQAAIAFNRHLGPNDVVTIEVTPPATFRVGLKITNPSLYEGLLDSFAFMYGTTDDAAGIRHNKPPRVSNLFISPEQILPGGPISANYTFTDPDGDEEDITKTEIIWYRNGSPVPELKNKRSFTNTDILSKRNDKNGNSLITKGQKWFFSVRPSDGKAFGPVVVSHTSIVSNVAPVLSNLRLSSNNEDDSKKFTSQDIVTVQFDYVDQDGDDARDNIIEWFVNGNSFKKGIENTLGPDEKSESGAKALAEGNVVFAQITPYDGQTYGITSSTIAIVVEGSAPVVSNVVISPAVPTTASRLRLTYSFVDVDGNQDSSTIAWFKNGVRQTELDDLLEVPPSLLVPKQQWYAVVTPSDGTVTGESVKSNTIVVQF